MQKILLINGPNLNMLGVREAEIYGNHTLDDILTKITDICKGLEVQLEDFQSNEEGKIINKIQQAEEYDGIIINAGGYTHSSVAIHDALKLYSKKGVIIEIHMSNIYAREEFRHKSLISPIADGIICGFGADSYFLAAHAMANLLANSSSESSKD